MSTYVYVEDDGQMVVCCCDGAHEAMYPLDDPEAVSKLLAALAEAGVLEEQRMIEYPDTTEQARFVSPWKEAK